MFKQLLKLTYQNNISLLYFQHLYAVHKVQIDSEKFQESNARTDFMPLLVVKSERQIKCGW